MTGPGEINAAALPSYVPQQYANLVLQAATGTGLPTNVVASQIYEESRFQPDATSSAGAEGMFQFLPSTYQEFVNSGLVPAGSEYDPNQEVKAYVGYTDELLRQEGGNVFRELAAYNAGPGNVPAGYGYASQILARAGAPGSLTSGGGSGPGAVTGGSSAGSSAGGTVLTSFLGDQFSGIEKTLTTLAIVVPAVIGGAALIVYGVVKMTGTGGAIKKTAEGAALL